MDVWNRNIGKLDYAQPDVHYIGGVSRTLRVARESIKHGKTFVPHSPNPSMIDIFAISMLAAIPNAYEYMEFDAINTDKPPDGTDFFTEKVFEIDRSDGTMKVPTGYGWGVELKQGLLSDATNQTTTRSGSGSARLDEL